MKGIKKVDERKSGDRERNDRRNADRKLDGSITVEMTMIVPIVVFTIVGIVLLGCYLNDVVSVRAVAYEYGIISQTREMTEEEIQQEVRSRLEKECLVSNIQNISVKKTKDTTELLADVSVSFRYFHIRKTSKIKVKTYQDNNRDYINKAKNVMDIIQKNKNGRQEG